MNVEKLSTGINGLDKVLNGGYLKNSPTLIKGGFGTKKQSSACSFPIHKFLQIIMLFLLLVKSAQEDLAT